MTNSSCSSLIFHSQGSKMRLCKFESMLNQSIITANSPYTWNDEIFLKRSNFRIPQRANNSGILFVPTPTLNSKWKKCVETGLKHLNMQGCKQVKVLIHMEVKLSTEQCPNTQEEIKYPTHVPSTSVIGSMTYAMVCA